MLGSLQYQGKWRQVADDLTGKCGDIDRLLQSDYTTQDHRVMSPLDRDTLVSLKNQLLDLQSPVRNRRELLQVCQALATMSHFIPKYPNLAPLSIHYSAS